MDTSRPYPEGPLREGQFIVYRFSLASIPTSRTVVHLTAREDIVQISPDVLVFESVTWNLPQLVRFSVPDNQQYSSVANLTDVVEVEVTSNDTNFDTYPQENLLFSIQDDELGKLINMDKHR